MSCENCQKQVTPNQALDEIKQQAQAYANEIKKTVAVYRDGAGFGYTSADAASGLPVVCYISALD